MGTLVTSRLVPVALAFIFRPQLLLLDLCSSLPVFEWDNFEMTPSCGAPKVGGAGCSPCSAFLIEGVLFLAGEFPYGAKQCWPGEWGDAGKMKFFFPTFLCSYSQIFPPCS